MRSELNRLATYAAMLRGGTDPLLVAAEMEQAADADPSPSYRDMLVWVCETAACCWKVREHHRIVFIDRGLMPRAAEGTSWDDAVKNAMEGDKLAEAAALGREEAKHGAE